MIKRIAFLVAATAVLVAAMSSCKKSRYCHCISDSYQTVSLDGETHTIADTTVVNIDRGMKCDGIKQMGFEKPQEGGPVVQVRNVDCAELDVESVSTIPSEHPVDD
jgi:hypothetical protein